MFNSTLLNDYPALTPFIQSRQIEILTFPYELWQDCGDQVFDGSFTYYFPPGFIDRDKERAKQVIRELYDIVQSPVIRYNPEAIHCYVMYHMMEAWFDDEYTKTQDLLPAELKKFLEGMDKEEDSDDDADLTEHDRIKQWFTDKESCLGDFEDTYDSDYMDETVAEGAAEAYLNNGYVPESLGVDLKELVELLPNDLYDKVLQKLRQSEANRDVETISDTKKGKFSSRHPWITGILISLIAGFILLFGFWKEAADSLWNALRGRNMQSEYTDESIPTTTPTEESTTPTETLVPTEEPIPTEALISTTAGGSINIVNIHGDNNSINVNSTSSVSNTHETELNIPIDNSLYGLQELIPIKTVNTRKGHVVFSGPGETYFRRKNAEIVSGTEVEVFGRENGWVFIRYYANTKHSQKFGWVPEDAFTEEDLVDIKEFDWPARTLEGKENARIYDGMDLPEYDSELTNLGTMPKGARVIGLALFDAQWVYCEVSYTTGRIGRGFINNKAFFP